MAVYSTGIRIPAPKLITQRGHLNHNTEFTVVEKKKELMYFFSWELAACPLARVARDLLGGQRLIEPGELLVPRPKG
jgi:hypothetical protein